MSNCTSASVGPRAPNRPRARTSAPPCADNAVAFDGRGGSSFTPARWLDRPASLSTLPWTLAVDAGAPVVVREPDRSLRLVVAAPIRGNEPSAVRDALSAIEPVLRRNPESYGPWVAHCRRFAEAHPLFTDVGEPATR